MRPRPRDAATALAAASSRLAAVVELGLLEERRRLRGVGPHDPDDHRHVRACWARASMSPRATSSPRVIPPKMLTRMASTLGSARMIRIAAATLSARAPPPMSRKLAGSPPARLTRSIVVIARPGTVDHAADRAVELDEGQPGLARLAVGWVLLVGVAQLLEPGMAGQRGVVEGDLGVEADQLARPARPSGLRSATIASGLISTRSAS